MLLKRTARIKTKLKVNTYERNCVSNSRMHFSSAQILSSLMLNKDLSVSSDWMPLLCCSYDEASCNARRSETSRASNVSRWAITRASKSATARLSTWFSRCSDESGRSPATYCNSVASRFALNCSSFRAFRSFFSSGDQKVLIERMLAYTKKKCKRKYWFFSKSRLLETNTHTQWRAPVVWPRV